MDLTQHYNLKKPTYGEKVDIQDLNDNADITDAQLNILADLVAKRLLKTDVSNQIINDQNKVASAATVYSVKQAIDTTNNNLAAQIYSSGNDLLVTRADDDSGIKYRLISSKSGLKLNKYVGDSGTTLWTAATNADLNTKVNKADNHNIAIGYDAAKKALSVTLDGVYIGNCTIAK